MRIVILGYIVRGPLGGLCWHYLQYIIGCTKLGHEVLFLEDSDNYPACYNPETFSTTTDPSYGINFINTLLKKHNLQNNWTYFDEHSNSWFGKTEKEVVEFCKSADLLINISNVNPLRDWWVGINKKALIDTDPAFTQIRHLQEINYRLIAKEHSHFFSFGENIGNADCLIPDDGFPWLPTRQPVVISLWPKITTNSDKAKWTTVMQWDSYKTRSYNGINYQMKSKAFEEYINFPLHTNEIFELAIGGESTPINKLRENKWHIINPLEVTKTAESFQTYIQQSKGEFSIAKHGYIISNSGWFSERSAGYLASGKPVVTQNTGFSKIYETEKGLFAFSTSAEAYEAISTINGDYSKHCRYASEIAMTYFDSSRVIESLLKNIE